MTLRWTIVVTIWAIMAAVVASGSSQAQPAFGAVQLAPHRAVYDITLDKAAPGSGVAELSGRMVYELKRTTCDSYAQHMRYVTQTTDAEGTKKLTDLRTSNWEPASSRVMKFKSSQYEGQNLAQATEGRADRQGIDAPVQVELRKPSSKKIELQPGIYFPTQHSRAIIAAAREGKSNLLANLYDGAAKGEKVYSTNAFIGAKLPIGSKELPADVPGRAKLAQMPAWPVSISYFEPGSGKQDQAPLYELSYRYYENGVSTRLRIDYGDFTIRGHLRELKFLPPSACQEK